MPASVPASLFPSVVLVLITTSRATGARTSLYSFSLDDDWAASQKSASVRLLDAHSRDIPIETQRTSLARTPPPIILGAWNERAFRRHAPIDRALSA